MVTDVGCKLDETVDRYDLADADPRHESLDEGLLARWNGTDGHSAVGYRTLTDWFNKQLLKTVYTQHGRESTDAQLDAEYETLTGDDDLARKELIDRLAVAGIDGEQLRADMISWGTMRTHLTACLGGSKERSGAQTNWERNSIGMAQEKLVETVDEALSSLGSKATLDGVDTSTVAVQIQLRCDHCPTQVPLTVALERGYVCERHSRAADETSADEATTTDETADSTLTQL